MRRRQFVAFENFLEQIAGGIGHAIGEIQAAQQQLRIFTLDLDGVADIGHHEIGDGRKIFFLEIIKQGFAVT